VERVLERVEALGALDDRRFALSYGRYRAGTRRLGPHRLARELRARGVAPELIEETLTEVFRNSQQEAELIRERLEKQLRNTRPPYPLKRLRSLYASLLRAGFSSAIIREELFRRARQSVDDFADNDDS
jgi:regulatory protein